MHLLEHGKTRNAVKLPIRVIVLWALAVLHITWVQSAGHNQWTADGRVAIESDLIELDDQSVAGEGTFNIKRPGKRIAAGGNA